MMARWARARPQSDMLEAQVSGSHRALAIRGVGGSRARPVLWHGARGQGGRGLAARACAPRVSDDPEALRTQAEGPPCPLTPCWRASTTDGSPAEIPGRRMRARYARSPARSRLRCVPRYLSVT